MKFDPLECRRDYNLYEPHSVCESVTSSLTLISRPKLFNAVWCILALHLCLDFMSGSRKSVQAFIEAAPPPTLI